MTFVYIREGRDNRIPIEAGDVMTMYELEVDVWPYSEMPPHRGQTQDEVDYEEHVLNHENSEKDWRIEDELHCDCKSRRTIAQLLVHGPTARLWASAKPERVPESVRTSGDGRGDAWVLHGAAGEAPHVGAVASCKGCRARWLVVSFIDHIEALKVKRAHHGAVVQL